MPDENQVLLKVPRQHNMYTFDMKNVDSSKGYTCLLAKASSDEAFDGPRFNFLLVNIGMFTMSNQHKDWLVQEQTALGKDFSNPFYGWQLANKLYGL
ncbi:hypothetical protein Tco_0829348 [Tanacetum coccineum]